MEAGRELDALVARKVLETTVYQATYAGYEVLLDKASTKYELYTSTDHGWSELPYYSTDIAAAWQVVEKMRNPDFRLNRDGDWVCWFGGSYSFGAEADTAPHAICLAALKAVGGDP